MIKKQNIDKYCSQEYSENLITNESASSTGYLEKSRFYPRHITITKKGEI